MRVARLTLTSTPRPSPSSQCPNPLAACSPALARAGPRWSARSAICCPAICCPAIRAARLGSPCARYELLSGSGGAWLLLLEAQGAVLTLATSTVQQERRRRITREELPEPSKKPPTLKHAKTSPAFGVHHSQASPTAEASPVAFPKSSARRSSITRINVADVADHRAEGGSMSAREDLPSEVWLPAGSLLWDTVTPAASTIPLTVTPAASTIPVTPAASTIPLPGACESSTGAGGLLATTEGAEAAPSPHLQLPTARHGLRWTTLTGVDEDGTDGLLVRACPLSTVRQRLVTLREASAREHAQVLADVI